MELLQPVSGLWETCLAVLPVAAAAGAGYRATAATLLPANRAQRLLCEPAGLPHHSGEAFTPFTPAQDSVCSPEPA